MADGKPGRPTICTPELQEQLVELLRDGMFLEPSCDLVRVSYAVVREWLTREDEPYATFAAAIRSAAAEGERSSIKMLRSGPQQWQAQAWFLERRHRDRWRRDIPADEQTQTPAPQVIVVQVPKSD